MARRNVYYGGQVGESLFLDIWDDTEYFFSLNRGGTSTTDVVQGFNSLSNVQDFTPEELQDGTFASFAGGAIVGAQRLYNQGTASVFFTAQDIRRPNIGNPSLYIYNDRMYLSAVENNSFMQLNNASSILDKNSTVYITYRSQNGLSIGGLLTERQTSNRRIAIFSDTRDFDFRHSNYRPSGINNPLSYASQQPQNELRVIAYRRNGNLVEAFDESGLVIDSLTSSDVFGGGTSLNLFLQIIGPLYFRGHIAEVIIRETADSNPTLQEIINHRRDYYGI